MESVSTACLERARCRGPGKIISQVAVGQLGSRLGRNNGCSMSKSLSRDHCSVRFKPRRKWDGHWDVPGRMIVEPCQTDRSRTAPGRTTFRVYLPWCLATPHERTLLIVDDDGDRSLLKWALVDDYELSFANTAGGCEPLQSSPSTGFLVDLGLHRQVRRRKDWLPLVTCRARQAINHCYWTGRKAMPSKPWYGCVNFS
jgi:hypothetical protein